MTLKCLECGSEQAGDAAECAACGAPVGVPTTAPAVLLTARGRARLRMDAGGIKVKDVWVAERVIGWDEVRWLRDGEHFHPSRRLRNDGWALAIVLKDGAVVIPDATKKPRTDAQEIMTAARHAARDHAIPAVLTGRPVSAKPCPEDKPGLYPDPGGEPGLREWTGTEWLPSLLVCPDGDGQAGPVSVMSPLPEDVQRREWDTAISAVPSPGVVAAVMFFFLLGWGAMLPYPLIAIPDIDRHGFWLGTSHALAALAWAGIFLWTCGLGALMWLAVRERRILRKVARAARQAAARAGATAAAIPAEQPDSAETVLPLSDTAA
jgi:hypothetical protein